MLRVLGMVTRNQYNKDDLYIDDSGKVYVYTECFMGGYLRSIADFGLSHILLLIDYQKSGYHYSDQEYSKLISILRKMEEDVHKKIESLANAPRQCGNTYRSIDKLQRIYEELSKMPEEEIGYRVKRQSKL